MGGKAQRSPEGRGQQGAQVWPRGEGLLLLPQRTPSQGSPRARLLGPCKAQRLVWQG